MVNENAWQQDVAGFHRAMGLSVSNAPKVMDCKTTSLRISLVLEETKELVTALMDNDTIKIADGIVDSIYVILGTAVSAGINISPIWDEIHKTNMAKSGGAVRKDGKRLKPEGWKPPEIEKLLVEQKREFATTKGDI